MKKLIAWALCAGLALNTVAPVFALTDATILSDPITNTYSGRAEAATIINNLSFTDIPNNFWAKEAIIKSGALGILKDYGTTYTPNASVTNEEVLSAAIRIIGRDEEALQLNETLPAATAAQTRGETWYVGYLNLAMQLELITAAQYNSAISAQPTIFARNTPASRENVVDWMYKALLTVDSEMFATTATQQSVYRFADFNLIAPTNVSAVEAFARTGIIDTSTGNFRPKAVMTRAEMAQIISNLDSIYNKTFSLEKKTGTIGAVSDAQYATTNIGHLGRNYYVRLSDGTMEMISYEQNIDTSPQSGTLDVIVYKDGNVSGLTALAEGDSIEYIVNTQTNQAYYIRVLTSELATGKVSGRLVSVNANSGNAADPNLTPTEGLSITIASNSGKNYSYTLPPSAITVVNSVRNLIISEKNVPLGELPIGTIVELELVNNIATKVTYVGSQVLSNEVQGIVLENNADMGYLVIIDGKSNVLTKYYNSGDIKVEKQQYYDVQDEIGYYDEMFPNFKYDPRDSVISAVEPGDIVYITMDTSDSNYVASISAVTNYIMKYGKIRSFTTNGNISSMLIEYEDKQQAWFDVAHEIFISEDGKPIEFSDVQVGDWAKILVNQAITEPGSIIESVKEMAIEGDEHFISTILKGKIALVNNIQNQMTLQNVYELNKSQWGNYKDLVQVSLAGNDTEYYYNDTRVNLDYVTQFLKRSSGDVYVALENNFAGERVKMITFRNERDSLLGADTVTSADGNGKFGVIGSTDQISTDQGTIVRRYGRLVDGSDISAPDYALISLNGENRAAVVDIDAAPSVAAVSIIRARILSVNEGTGFKVQSLSMFTGKDWSYTPIQREFSIDHETLFLNGQGYVDSSEFMDFGNNTAYDKVYNIVVDGTRAARVLDAPYVQNYLRGTIYQIDGDIASIKDVTYYDSETGRWKNISNSNSQATVTIHPNTIIAKQNLVIGSSGLKVGDQINAGIVNLPANITGGMNFDAYIVQVEK